MVNHVQSLWSYASNTRKLSVFLKKEWWEWYPSDSVPDFHFYCHCCSCKWCAVVIIYTFSYHLRSYTPVDQCNMLMALFTLTEVVKIYTVKQQEALQHSWVQSFACQMLLRAIKVAKAATSLVKKCSCITAACRLCLSAVLQKRQQVSSVTSPLFLQRWLEL